jgi:exopolyphosphatase/guanosine-5'-triphosphate,3'-diphosphate pyrophosphatase
VRTSLAVVDVGSNSGRAVVLRQADGGHFEILAGGRAPLRLARDVERGGRLTEQALDRTVQTLRDFRALANGSGAERILAVATAAVRDSDNSGDLVERSLRDAGLHLDVIDGETEARLSFLGAIHGLPVEHGMLIDLGGGSMEISRFRARAFVRSWTLALGSLSLSDRFLVSDPPGERELDRLHDHVRSTLEAAGVPPLGADETLIGTGGTIRNLAKVDRQARTNYPIPRLHGYVLSRRRMGDLAQRVASRSLSRRKALPGLSRERADSIVGGAAVVATTLDAVRGSEIVVSGQGLREGLALQSLNGELPPAADVRKASVAALVSRFATWEAGRAERRSRIAAILLEATEPAAGPNARERLDQAATLLDIGRSIDYYRRYEHTADIVVAADLEGFSHRKLAMLAAVIRQAGDERTRIRGYRPLLTSDDQLLVARAGTILLLADEIEHRMLPDDTADTRCRDVGRAIEIAAPIFDPWRREALEARFRRAFRKRLSIEPAGGAEARDA